MNVYLIFKQKHAPAANNRDANSYNIYYGIAANITKTNGAKIANVTSPYVHTGITNGTAYFYIVTAEDATTESEASMEANATPLVPTTSTTAVDMGGGISISFVSISKGSFVMGSADGSADDEAMLKANSWQRSRLPPHNSRKKHDT